MIKITINNEEVVCDKNLEINEEMLTTSSIILDNVYPKTWETTHDYISNFYYPKDFSMCKIADVKQILYDPGTTVEGTSLTIDYDNNKKWEYQLLGDTSQNGTPTPSSPISVKVVTGENSLVISNSNNTQSQTYPISLGSLELCKIGDHQDYIYYSNGNWYKREYIGKVILDGSESWGKSANRFVSGVVSSLIKPTTSNSETAQIFSNKFIGVSINQTTQSSPVNGIAIAGSGNLVVYYDVLKDYTYHEFATWLSSNNVLIYYVLATPTETEITDETLISQLNAVSLLNGYNDISNSGDLAGIIKLHYNFVNASQITDLIFAGMVKNTGNISLNPRYPHYCSVQVLSFSDFLSTGDTLDFVISEKTVTQAIQMIIDTVAPYGFVLGNINILGANDVIGAYSTQDKTAYDVFNYLANITGSRWTTRMIDEHTVAVDFYDPSLMPQGTNIEYTNEWFEEYDIEDISFNYGTRDYRNKQVMLSDEVYADITYTETIIADGYNTNFLLSSNIGVMSRITVNGVEATFTLKENHDYGVSADFYYSNGSNGLESDSLYTAGTQINVTYIPLVQGRQVVYNYDEVTRVAGQTERKGVFARYENRNDVTSSDELVKIGQSYLKYKGSPEINLTVKTTQNIWNVGQTVYFDAPLNELDTDYMVKSKKILILPLNNKVFYTYTLVSSFNSENAINYFDNQRSKNTGNISQGDFITRNVDLENQALIIFSNASATEITVTGDNVLDSTLDSPFIQ